MSWAAEAGWFIIGVAFTAGGPNEPIARGPFDTRSACVATTKEYLAEQKTRKGRGAFLLCQYKPHPHPSWSRKTPLKKLS